MAFIVFSGHPSSGKSLLAARLQKMVQEEGRACLVISEESLGLTRDGCYSDARSEKVARGQLKAEVERCIGRQHVVILDSMNAIKGYRYELYCLARGAAVRYCMVHVDTPIETCRTWNEARPADARYATAVFADLAGRFERPDSRQRWDAPLFTVRPAAAEGEAEVQAQLRAVLVSALDLAQHADREPGSEGRPVPPASRALAPTIATTNARLSSTNLLHEIDRGAHQVMDAISAAQELRPGGAPGTVQFSGEIPSLRMDRPMHVAELRRHKRAFLRLVTNLSLTKAPDAVTAQRMFVDYLADQLTQQ
ncbi:KTI12-like protein [Auxenochlorella protothecoides]|uniref:KTI12-like protein n=1 Tax=Auxenochlorella protothecoides TaxID=3075 RepID=A0A087SSU6_AUXPR|nr:KTI12-like protein [Auxenochlorella protothecoides]KFM28800.1 KTI12-like protein [Auxenochlorella protothecoides]RMZ55108.1 hypothetical protein APUTEX25_005386 [Auxenochlorella protothecoides]|eukprot:RMZ55108.1 hypothetical protein APUTEX25_005386 [Auxenochlorella protothecoides]